MHHDYSPFEKDFADLTTADLVNLRTVAEGWYVEYKRELSSAAAIAKSISAFSNTYGGWLFYGISEKAKDDAVAGEFPGIPREQADAALQRIRQSVAASVQPAPFFETRVFFGPEPLLDLAEDRCVIAVRVPWGAEAPFIHRDGRIYRRVADGSEPRPETDRYIVDQLSARSSKTEAFYKEWVDSDVETSTGEEKAAYVRIFLIADFWGDHPPVKDVPIGVIRRIMSDSAGDYTLPVDNVYPTTGGFICRQTSTNDPEGLNFTWILHSDFRSEIVVPLAKFKSGNLTNLRSQLYGYDHADRFIELCRKQRYDDPTVIDLNILLLVLMGIARKHAALAEQFGWAGPMMAKARLSGIWRTIAYFDASHVLDDYDSHGLPLNLSDDAVVFPGKRSNSYFELAPSIAGEAILPNLMMAVGIFVRIATALGATVWKDDDDDEKEALKIAIVEFVMAGQRALTAQARRASVSLDNDA